MSKNKFPIFTKFMFFCSSIILLFLLIGFVISLSIKPKMKNTNYGFSDPVQISLFENSLYEEGIPFDRISNTVISVPENWTTDADIIFQKYND